MVKFNTRVEKKRKFNWKRLVYLLSVVAIGTGVWALSTYTEPMNYFTLQHIQVAGNQRVSSEEIRSVLSLRTSTGLFCLNLNSLERKLENDRIWEMAL